MRLRSHLLLFCRSVVSDSLRPHGLQLPQASLSFTISHSLLKLMSIESVMPSNHLILCSSRLLLPQSFPASESFPTSQFFTSSGQSIRASASASVLPKKVIKNSKIRHGHIDWRRIPCLDRQCSMFS